jgi:hypothetical protein
VDEGERVTLGQQDQRLVVAQAVELAEHLAPATVCPDGS